MGKYDYKVKGYAPERPDGRAPRPDEPYRYIALDIDGTLTNSEKKITPATRQALIDAEKRGIRLILASGRPIHGLKKLARELEMDRYHGVLLGLNGGAMADAETGEILFERALDKDLAVKILKHVSAFDVVPMIAYGDTLYVTDGDGYKVAYEAGINDLKIQTVPDLVAFAEAADFPIYKVLTAADPEYLKTHWEAMRAPFVNDVSSMFTADFYYEFAPKGINKSTGLHGLLLKLGAAPGEVMAFGDAQNDEEMIDLAGMGVAMGNASTALKENADYITKSNDEDGVGYAVTQFTE